MSARIEKQKAKTKTAHAKTRIGTGSSKKEASIDAADKLLKILAI